MLKISFVVLRVSLTFHTFETKVRTPRSERKQPIAVFVALLEKMARRHDFRSNLLLLSLGHSHCFPSIKTAFVDWLFVTFCHISVLQYGLRQDR